jgi:predicted TIM-barrel fold metal-dependent hydrolase
MLRVDAHLHVWRASAVETPLVKTLVSPQTDVTIELAADVLVDHHIERAVLVQPVFPGEDNSYIAACARAQPDRFAAVCVVDPRVSGADVRLQYWVEQGCRGLRLRPRIADEAKSFGEPSTFVLWEAAARLGAVVNVLSGPEHNATIGALAERFPQVPIVIDHLGQPDVAAGLQETGFRQLLALGKRENVFVKLSGFYHFSREPYPYRDCWKLTDAVYEAFGPTRLMWGSDFPHVTVACSYGRSLDVLEAALGPCPEADARCVLGRNALELYWPATAPSAI